MNRECKCALTSNGRRFYERAFGTVLALCSDKEDAIMNQLRLGCIGAAMYLCFVGATCARADTVLWYNGDTNGVSSYVNQDNGQFSQVLYNDFDVTGNWVID